jgi:uncharacterized tellurite resistance protein B-like protein
MMIFFGTRGLTLTGESGEFFCPSCNNNHHYKRRKVRRFFTLYFVPLIPLDLLGEYIECQTCKNTYNDSVFEFKARADAERQDFESEYERAVRKSMAITALADGVVDDAEVEAMKNIYSSITGNEVDKETVLSEIEATKKEGLTIDNYLKTINGLVNTEGKELIVRALISIAYADGDFDEAEQKTLMEALTSLDISESHFREIMSSFQE